MKKIVVKSAIDDEKAKRKAMTLVAGVEGVDSVTADMKEKKITIIGSADPVDLTNRLRKVSYTELVSVGPAKEEKKEDKKEEKKPEPKKETKPEVRPVYIQYPYPWPEQHPHPWPDQYLEPLPQHHLISEESSSSCTIL